MSMIRFDKVDVVFSNTPQQALTLLDEGLTRDEILKKTGLIVGVESASFEVAQGEICVLMGLSGSGKSSLLRCINGLNTISRGHLLIQHEGHEVDIANCSAATLQSMRTKRIAMVFQKFALMPWLTVEQNVAMPLELQGLPKAEIKRRVNWPDKKVLAKLVWGKPLIHLAKEIGASDVALRKHCVKLGIELPRQGHWLRQ